MARTYLKGNSNKTFYVSAIDDLWISREAASRGVSRSAVVADAIRALKGIQTTLSPVRRQQGQKQP